MEIKIQLKKSCNFRIRGADVSYLGFLSTFSKYLRICSKVGLLSGSLSKQLLTIFFKLLLLFTGGCKVSLLYPTIPVIYATDLPMKGISPESISHRITPKLYTSAAS